MLLVIRPNTGWQPAVAGVRLEDRPAARRERTSAAISSMLMLFRHKLSLQGDRRWLSGPMHGLQE